MWTGPFVCRTCGAGLAGDFVFCHRCGADLRVPVYGSPYAPAFPSVPPKPRPSDYRTRRGLVATLWGLVLVWFPGVATLGGLLLSVGSTYLFLDAKRFPPTHATDVRRAYGILWLAAILYGVAFGAFLWEAYDAWIHGRLLDTLQGGALVLVVGTTPPTLLVVGALALQVRRLLPAHLLRHLWIAVAVTAAGVAAATVLGYLDLAAGIPSERIRIAGVNGILNRIALVRIVEAPGFLTLAYLYHRAHRRRVEIGKEGDVGARAVPADG